MLRLIPNIHITLSLPAHLYAPRYDTDALNSLAASREKGEKIFMKLLDRLVELVAEYHQQPVREYNCESGEAFSPKPRESESYCP